MVLVAQESNLLILTYQNSELSTLLTIITRLHFYILHKVRLYIEKNSL